MFLAVCELYINNKKKKEVRNEYSLKKQEKC